VGRVLGLMPGTIFAGELRRLWGPSMQARHCGCGKSFDRCEVWSALLVDGASYLQPNPNAVARLQRQVAPAERSWLRVRPLIRRTEPPDPRSPEGRYLRALSDLYVAFAARTDARILVDTSKNLGDAALLRFAEDVDAYCVHVVRDPRGVILTRRKLATRDPSRPRPIETLRTTAYWSLTHWAATSVVRTFAPGSSFQIRYETFAEDPRTSLEALAGPLGTTAPSLEARDNLTIDVPAAHGPDGRGRFPAGSLVIDSEDDWSQELNTLDRGLASIAAYPLLRRYNYALR
jgi:Sulfotransferase family